MPTTVEGAEILAMGDLVQSKKLHIRNPYLFHGNKRDRQLKYSENEALLWCLRRRVHVASQNQCLLIRKVDGRKDESFGSDRVPRCVPAGNDHTNTSGEKNGLALRYTCNIINCADYNFPFNLLLVQRSQGTDPSAR